MQDDNARPQSTVPPDRRKPFGPKQVPRLAKARRDVGSAILYERVAEAYDFEWQDLLDRIYLAMREADERAQGDKPGSRSTDRPGMSDRPETTIDPTKEDLWMTPVMGPAHLFRAGCSVAVCGRNWFTQGWGEDRKPPARDFCCSACWEVAHAK